MASPVAVVDTQFCVPCTLPLTVTVSRTLGGSVTVAGGAAVLRVDAPLLGLIRRFVLADAAGQPLVSIQKKPLRWEAFRGSSWHARDLLFTARRSPILQVWTQVAVFLPPNTAWQSLGAAGDLTMKCDYLDRSCDVYLGKSSTRIAHVRRHFSAAGVLLGRETFSVTVSPNVDYVFVAALVVMLSEIVQSGVTGRRRLH